MTGPVASSRAPWSSSTQCERIPFPWGSLSCGGPPPMGVLLPRSPSPVGGPSPMGVPLPWGSLSPWGCCLIALDFQTPQLVTNDWMIQPPLSPAHVILQPPGNVHYLCSPRLTQLVEDKCLLPGWGAPPSTLHTVAHASDRGTPLSWGGTFLNQAEALEEGESQESQA